MNSAHAEGQHASAHGHASHAEGLRSVAQATAAHAEGHMSRAEGTSSHAEGIETLAFGNYSHAEGAMSEAHNYGAHAEGHSFANGHYSHSEGYMSEANGMYSHAEGAHTATNLNFSHVEGLESATQAYGYVVNSVNGNTIIFEPSYVNEEGIVTSINLINELEVGMILSVFDKETFCNRYTAKITSINGANSLTIENNTELLNHLSNELTMKSRYTTMVLINNGVYGKVPFKAYYIDDDDNIVKEQSLAVAAHAEGINTRAYISGHAEGIRTNAKGYASHAEGYYTSAEGDYQHVQGTYNTPDTTSAFIIGNGEDEQNRSNAMTVDWDGNAWFSKGISTGAGKNALFQTMSATKDGTFTIKGNYTGANNAEGINYLISNGYGVRDTSTNGVIINSVADGKSSACLNGKSRAANDRTFVANSSNIACGKNAVAMGNYNISSGDTSFVEGGVNVGSGPYSHTGGYGNYTKGSSSFTHGTNSIVEGQMSASFGNANHIYDTKTTGAVALGGHSEVNGSYSLVAGTWNVKDVGNFPGTNGPTTDGKRQYVMIVGNGTETQRSNAMTLDWKGNMVLSGDLTIKHNNK